MRSSAYLIKECTPWKSRRLERFPDYRDYFNKAKSRAGNGYSLLQDIHVLAVQKEVSTKEQKAE